MAEPLPLRIFLASPGDLDDERAAVRACVAEHKARLGANGGISYEIVEWSQTRGTAERPQGAINELIAECHFMIVLFKDSWGSQPGSPWGYTSGTEEELFEGLLQLGQPSQPMRDVWLAFVEGSSRNPRVEALRRQIISRNSLLFESFPSSWNLKENLAERLVSWEAMAGQKAPRNVDLLPSSGRDVLRAANLRLKGEALVELGQTAAGAECLQEAAAIGGPTEWLSFARLLRHAGKFEDAYAQTQRAIEVLSDQGPLFSTATADAFAAQGRRHDVVGRLERALTLIVDTDEHAQSIRCRMLDELGLARRAASDPAGARSAFEAALKVRRASGVAHDVGQSLINLARLEVAEGQLEVAAEYADSALSTIRGSAPTGLHANAEVLVAQIRLRQGLAASGVPHSERALAVNRQLGNKKGEAIALLLLAQCCRQAGQLEDARHYAEACLEVNRALGDASGQKRAQWLIDRLTE